MGIILPIYENIFAKNLNIYMQKKKKKTRATSINELFWLVLKKSPKINGAKNKTNKDTNLFNAKVMKKTTFLVDKNFRDEIRI